MRAVSLARKNHSPSQSWTCTWNIRNGKEKEIKAVKVWFGWRKKSALAMRWKSEKEEEEETKWFNRNRMFVVRVTYALICFSGAFALSLFLSFHPFARAHIHPSMREAYGGKMCGFCTIREIMISVRFGMLNVYFSSLPYRAHTHTDSISSHKRTSTFSHSHSAIPFNWPQFSFRHCVRFRRAHVIDTFTLFRFDFFSLCHIHPHLFRSFSLRSYFFPRNCRCCFIHVFHIACFWDFNCWQWVCVCACGVRAHFNDSSDDDGLLVCDCNAIDVIALPKFDENQKWAGKWGTNALFWVTYVHSLYSSEIELFQCYNMFKFFDIFLSLYSSYGEVAAAAVAATMPMKAANFLCYVVHISHSNAVCACERASACVSGCRCLSASLYASLCPLTLCISSSWIYLHRFLLLSIGISMSHACRQFTTAVALESICSVCVCVVLVDSLSNNINRERKKEMRTRKPMSLRKKRQSEQKKRKAGVCTPAAHTQTK